MPPDICGAPTVLSVLGLDMHDTIPVELERHSITVSLVRYHGKWVWILLTENGPICTHLPQMFRAVFPQMLPLFGNDYPHICASSE